MTATTQVTATLLVIDAQNDFHPGGSLAVPAADGDARRIASLIRRGIRSNGDGGDTKLEIDRIVATLDTHHKLHVAHPTFWVDGASRTKHPDPFTILSAQDLIDGKWVPRPDLKRPVVDVVEEEEDDTNVRVDNCMKIDPRIFGERAVKDLQDADDTTTLLLNPTKYCIEYAKRLERKGRFQICVWPEHCLIGSTGHAIVPEIQRACMEWTDATGTTIQYVMKGQNVWTEMYSAFEADVPVSKDTSYNESLFKTLQSSVNNSNNSVDDPQDQQHVILVCGQAMSHCVNYTVRDLVRKWPTTKKAKEDADRDDKRSGPPPPIWVLLDCTSPVPGFEAAAERFRTDMEQTGLVKFVSSTDLFS